MGKDDPVLAQQHTIAAYVHKFRSPRARYNNTGVGWRPARQVLRTARPPTLPLCRPVLGWVLDKLPRPTLRTHKTHHRRLLNIGQGHHVLGDAEPTKRMATRNTQRTERFARVVSDTILKRKPVRNVSCGHDTLRYPLLSVAVSLCLRIPLSFSVLLPIPPLV